MWDQSLYFPRYSCSLEIQEVALEETPPKGKCAFAWLVQGTSYRAVAQTYPTYRAAQQAAPDLLTAALLVFVSFAYEM